MAFTFNAWRWAREHTVSILNALGFTRPGSPSYEVNALAASLPQPFDMINEGSAKRISPRNVAYHKMVFLQVLFKSVTEGSLRISILGILFKLENHLKT